MRAREAGRVATRLEGVQGPNRAAWDRCGLKAVVAMSRWRPPPPMAAPRYCWQQLAPPSAASCCAWVCALQWHRSPSGTPSSALSMCFPQPTLRPAVDEGGESERSWAPTAVAERGRGRAHAGTAAAMAAAE